MAKKKRESRFGRLDMRMWGDRKFLSLSPQKPSGQALWIYLLAGPLPKRMPGIILAGKVAIGEQLGWSRRIMSVLFRELIDAGMIKYSEKPPLVWLLNAHRYEQPQNEAHLVSWRQAWLEVPECPLKDEMRQVFMTEWGSKFAAAAGAVFGSKIPPTRGGTVGGDPPPHPGGDGGGAHLASSIYTPLSPPTEEGGNQAAAKPVPTDEATAAGVGMLAAPIRELVKLYRERVDSQYGVNGGEQAITEAISRGGATLDALRRGIEGYAAQCKRERIERGERPGLAGFVRKGLWRECADPELAAPPAKAARPAKAEEAPEVSPEERARARAKLQAALKPKGGGGDGLS